jgi:hypothetical protein
MKYKQCERHDESAIIAWRKKSVLLMIWLKAAAVYRAGAALQSRIVFNSRIDE